MSSLILTPDSVSLDTLSNISYPLFSTYDTVTTITPNKPNLALSPSSYTIQTMVSPPGTNTIGTYTANTILSPVYTRVPFNMLAVKPTVYVDIDTGLNDSYIVQKDVTKYFMYKTLDKWIFKEFPEVLMYLVSKGNKIELVKKLSDKDNNDIKNESKSVLSDKKDWLEKNVLTESKTRDVLIRIMKETGLKWFELPYREELVKDVMERYLNKKLKKMIMGVDEE